MRSRSTRLFVVLLHLAGVSTHLPFSATTTDLTSDDASGSSYDGAKSVVVSTIRAVTQSERFDREDGTRGNKDVVVWLQVVADSETEEEMCLLPYSSRLGPCSETALWEWTAITRSLQSGADISNERRGRSLNKLLDRCLFNCESSVGDVQTSSSSHPSSWYQMRPHILENERASQVVSNSTSTSRMSTKRSRRRATNSYCLQPNKRPAPSSRKQQDAKIHDPGWLIETRPKCKRTKKSGGWAIVAGSSSRTETALTGSTPEIEVDHGELVYRDATSQRQFCLRSALQGNGEVRLYPCDGSQAQPNSGGERTSSDKTLMFTIVHFYPAPTLSLPLSTQNQSQSKEFESEPKDRHYIKTATQGDLAHTHASVEGSFRPAGSSTRKSASSATSVSGISVRTGRDLPLHPKAKTHRATRQTGIQSHSQKDAKNPLSNFPNSDPVLFVNDAEAALDSAKDPPTAQTNKKKAGSSSSRSKAVTVGKQSAEYKLKRMQTHPYLAAAKNGEWKDPATGLVYPTDLCQYLGHERRDVGRHTLVGVGQYTRTVFKVKVYGVALYVSKRDVLADPGFQRYARDTSDQLREQPDFYSHLRHMPSTTNPKTSGWFDRTLYLKLNMQLSTETMRSSLQGDWKLLTDEQKLLLIDSSLRPRPALPPMLKTISDRENNPNRCSCGQVAPPEYQADRSCCARGTTLVFTWRKNGDLEVRVDGRVMDAFVGRKDVAQGIFYEYLRTDDPISPDFSERVVDGWPFLLGPLAQVQGVDASTMMPPPTSRSTDSTRTSSGPREGGGGGLGDMMGWMKNATQEVASGALQTAKNGGSDTRKRLAKLAQSARGIGSGVLHRQSSTKQGTSLEGGHLSHRHHQRRDALASSVGHWLRRFHTIMEMASRNAEKSNTEDQLLSRGKSATYSRSSRRGRIFRSPVNHWLGEQFSSPTNDPNTRTETVQEETFGHRLFLSFVHFYLLLLLIVSLPGPHGTRIVFRSNSGSLSKHQSSANLTTSVPGSSSGHFFGNPMVSSRGNIYDYDEVGDSDSSSEWHIGEGRQRTHELEETRATIGGGGKMRKSLSYYL